RVTLGSARRLLWIGVDGGLAFGLLWILALAGWWTLLRARRWDHPLLRLTVLIPLALVLPVLLYANIGRLWYLAFPSIIPLALVPLRRILAPAEPPIPEPRVP